MFKSVAPSVNFPELERKILDYWQKENINKRYLHRNDKSLQCFSFIDGPITANNPMGVHHAWGRTFKDLWQRFYNMRGYRERFQNGFDCQGLWVEVEVEKELKLTSKKEIENLVPNDKKESIAKFVELCRKRVFKYSKIQTEQSKRLGYFMDWDNSYFTMSDENNYMIWHFLKTCYKNGWIYKGRDSVPWCPRCETAISEHEMLTEDYKELTHESIFFKLRAEDLNLKNKVKNIYFLVWTTTPWTIPANVAVGINSKYTYGIWENKRKDEAVIIISKDEQGNIPKRIYKGKEMPVSDYIFFNIDGKFKKTGEVSGRDLAGRKYSAPFDYLPRVQKAKEERPDTFHTVVDASKIVEADEGTGLLHVATGAGREDFKLGKERDLPVISVILDNADYLDGMAKFSGKNAKKHPEIIIDYLKDHEGGVYLFKTMPFTHRYPACWRCKTELVWKVEKEWYIAMDKCPFGDRLTLRQRMIEAAKKIRWIPEFGLERELDWLSNMEDWLISKKNRYWGLTLPIYECGKCGRFEVIGGKDELKKRAVSGWDKFEGKSPHKPYIDEVKIRCGKCGSLVSRIDDVGNPWLDAGIVPFSTLIDSETKKLSYIDDKKYWRKFFPADFITESFPGQFKNWFYSLIAMSAVLENRPAFKTVLGFATLLGEDGRPMHKSWGNSIEFNEGAEKIGVDVMRWMYVMQNPRENLLFGYKKADEIRRRFHLRLWNVYNFFVSYANVDKFKSQPFNSTKGSKSKGSSTNVLDKWIISKLSVLISTVTKSLVDYDAYTASMAIGVFVDDLSTWYIRRSRKRAGPAAVNGSDKFFFYDTFYKVLVTLAKLLAPFTPFLAEEIYHNLTSEKSVHLADWPEVKKRLIDKKLDKEMEDARSIVVFGHAFRRSENIKVRQPLSGMEYMRDGKLTERVEKLIMEELNIKSLRFTKSDALKGKFTAEDLRISPELKAEGEARELVRRIQLKRKELGYELTERIRTTLPNWPDQLTDEIRKETLSEEIIKGDKFLVEKL